jgi:hypothetical protein
LRRACAFALALFACSSAPFEGLAPARNRGGPIVQFDLTAQPFPAVPFPNDVLTRPDPTSPTGLRLNAPLIAPSELEARMRGLLDTLDGFGTFAPISVAFDKDLDVLDLFNRQNDGDPANDGAYLVDLSTGATVPLDFDAGHFPATRTAPGPLFANDPDAGAFNLLFPVSGPFANFLHPAQPHATLREQADDLLTFYERETRTLILRPVTPLAQERRYAVVLTDRIHGADGAPISSPHSGINHASQTAELQPLLAHLPPGTLVSDIAYAWAFTTQSVTRDLEVIRQGLQAQGPLQLLAFQYPVQTNLTSTIYSSEFEVLQESGAFNPATSSADPTTYILTPAQLQAALSDPALQPLLAGGDPAALAETYRYVDYFVSGAYFTPNFLENGPGAAQEQLFGIDPATTIARASQQRVAFLLAVPKEIPEVGHVAPFPTVIAGHGDGASRLQPVLAFAGTFAKFGLATIAIDAFGHGLGLDPATEQSVRDALHRQGLDAFAAALFTSRARDLDNDGVADPGGDLWIGDAFHTRDVVRQSVVDSMQLIRLLRTFDGTGTMVIGNTTAKAGDFNRDGVPDVGGPPFFPFAVTTSNGTVRLFEKGDRNPGADLFAFGQSVGGIVTAILPAVEPGIVAAAPVSAAGGLADVPVRSALPGITQGVFLDLLGPLFVTCHFDPAAGPVDAQTGAHTGACAAGAPDTLALAVADVNRERDLPIAPLALSPGQRVMVKNLARTAADCSAGTAIDGCSVGSADAEGRLVLPIAANWPSLHATVTPRDLPQPPDVQVQVIAPGDRLEVSVFPLGAGAPRVIDTFALAARFNGVDYPAGAPLTSPARGFGLSRNTPALRRMLELAQMILDPADPVNYAQHWSRDLLEARTASEDARVAGPANSLVIGTSGDPAVPISTTFSLARAAGLVELSKPDPAYGISIDQVLIRSGATEGIAATRRFDDPQGGVFAALPGHVRCDAGANCTGDALIDLTGYSCSSGTCTDALQAPRLDPPLQRQLARNFGAATACPVNKRAGAPGCYSTGASACDPAAPGMSALMIPYLNRNGQHGFGGPQPGEPFDVEQFMANAVGRYFECRGRDLRFDECQQDLARCPWIPQPPK